MFNCNNIEVPFKVFLPPTQMCANGLYLIGAVHKLCQQPKGGGGLENADNG